MEDTICDNNLWDGNIVTCPLCKQPATLVEHQGTDYKGDPCPAYWITHTTTASATAATKKDGGAIMMMVCEVAFDVNTGRVRIVKKQVFGR